jgi:hypothetical protein
MANAMVKCSECGCDISDNVEVCPGCGAPVTVNKRATPPLGVHSDSADTLAGSMVLMVKRALHIAQKIACLFQRHDNIATGSHEGAGHNDLFSPLATSLEVDPFFSTQVGKADNKVDKPKDSAWDEGR